MTDTKFNDYDIDTEYFKEMFKLSELETFKGDAYLVATLEEMPEETMQPED